MITLNTNQEGATVLKQSLLLQSPDDPTAKIKIDSIESLLELYGSYFKLQSDSFSNRSGGFENYGSEKLLKIHSEHECLYFDKYISCIRPDPQLEFLLESMGCIPEQYGAQLGYFNKKTNEMTHLFHVNSCLRDGSYSIYVSPNIKAPNIEDPNIKIGRSWNPYVRFLSSKVSGAEQVHKLMDLVGTNFKNLDNPNPTVFDLLVLTFPFEISQLLLNPKKRDSVMNKAWQCWNLFFKELYRWFGIDSLSQLLGASVSMHPWGSEFPFLPHLHLHVVFPHFSYLKISKRYREDSEYVIDHLYDELYGCVHEDVYSACKTKPSEITSEDRLKSKKHKGRNITSFDDTKKTTIRYIKTEDLEKVNSLKIEISKELSNLLNFNVLSWDGYKIKTSDKGIDYKIPLPINVDVFRSIWTECVQDVFSEELGANKPEDLDVYTEPVFDLHTQWVKSENRPKLLHHMQYKTRPPVLDLDLFLKQCPDLILDYNKINPDAVISLIRSRFVEAVLHEDIGNASRYESILLKIEKLVLEYSKKDFLEWLRFLCKYCTDTKVFGFWRIIKRYRITSIIHGELPRSRICPICGGETAKVCSQDEIYFDFVIIHVGSRYLVYDVKDPPDLGG